MASNNIILNRKTNHYFFKYLRIYTTFFFALLLLIVSDAAAELVSTRLGTNEEGHAWLFGSPMDGSCWIAAPAHVFEGDDRQLKKGILQLSKGGEIQLSEVPVKPDPKVDLAFSPVNIDKHCHDRLGPDDLSQLISTTDNVKLTILVSSVQIGFDVRIRSLAQSGHIEVKPTSEQVNLVPGFSGGLISAKRAGLGDHDVLVGLLLRVCGPVSDEAEPADLDENEPCDGEHHYGIALRFDKIKGLFTSIDNGAPRTSGKGVVLLPTSGRTLDALQGPANAFGTTDNQTCWRVKSDSYGRVTATFRTEGKPIHRVLVYACADGENHEMPSGAGLSFKSNNSNTWSSVRYCRSQPEAATLIDCYFAPRSNAKAYKLEFKTKTKHAIMAIGGIMIE